MERKALITGVTGQDGSYLAEFLLGKGYEVHGIKRRASSFVNVGVGEDLSIAELANLIAQTVGIEGGVDYDASKPDGAPRKLLDCRRLGRLGWQATTNMRDGLVIAYDDFQTRYGL